MSDEEERVHEDDGQDDAERPIRIFTAVCIEGAGLKKKSWQPAVQTVSGCSYLKLNKWDRYLTQFVTGKGMRLHCNKEHNINVQWFHTMVELRRGACQESLSKVILQAAEAEGTPAPKKIRQATQQDEYLAGRTVKVQAPCVESQDGEVVHDGLQMQMLWGIKGADLWVELTEANLQYVRLAIQHSPSFTPPEKKRARGGASPRKRRKRGPKSRAVLRDDEATEDPPEIEASEEQAPEEQAPAIAAE
eukprot:s1534_g9.t1